MGANGHTYISGYYFKIVDLDLLFLKKIVRARAGHTRNLLCQNSKMSIVSKFVPRVTAVLGMYTASASEHASESRCSPASPPPSARRRGDRARSQGAAAASWRLAMTTYVLSHDAYCKIILHALKYPHAAVNGVLIGSGCGGRRAPAAPAAAPPP